MARRQRAAVGNRPLEHAGVAIVNWRLAGFTQWKVRDNAPTDRIA